MSDFQESCFGCFSDIGSCLIGCFVPCYLGAQIRTILDERECFCCDCCCWTYSEVWYGRQQIRAKYGMSYNPIMDCLLTMFCGPCLNCQHRRELKQRSSK